MVDLSEDMLALAERLGPPPAAGARVLQFLSARSGEGASTVAREFARAVAPRSRRGVWLVELDLLRGGQFDAVAAAPAVFGDLGEPAAASPGDDAFFRVEPPREGPDGAPWPDGAYLDAYPVGTDRFWLTRFRRELLEVGQSVEVAAGPGYWEALRPHADWVVVDAPAVDRSRAGLVLAPVMDAVFLVVSADDADPRGPAHVRDAVAAAGGNCAGVVLNRTRREPPRFLRAFTR